MGVDYGSVCNVGVDQKIPTNCRFTTCECKRPLGDEAIRWSISLSYDTLQSNFVTAISFIREGAG
jgi:hypothetical protein